MTLIGKAIKESMTSIGLDIKELIFQFALKLKVEELKFKNISSWIVGILRLIAIAFIALFVINMAPIFTLLL